MSLELQAQKRDNQTILTRCGASYPYKAVPFRRLDGVEVVVMSASPGVLEGDILQTNIRVEGGAKLILRGQSYTKLFRMLQHTAEQKIRLQVERGGELRYLPPPVIAYAGSAFYSDARVDLTKGARFVWAEIFSCGRVGRGERFAFREYHSRLQVWEEERLCFADNLLFIPRQGRMETLGIFEGYTHCGQLYLYGYQEPQLPRIYDGELAFCRAEVGGVVRMLGHSAEALVKTVQTIVDALQAEYE